jgi:predicted kinase
MSDPDPAHRSLLVIVSGAPASGKTTVSIALGDRLAIPVLSKDVVKEALFDALGVGDRDWSRQLGTASVEVLVALARAELRHGRSVIIESTLHPEFDAPRFDNLIAETGAVAAQVHCTAADEVIMRRAHERAGQRHPGHVDQGDLQALRASLEAGRWRPLEVTASTFGIDTSHEEPGALDRLAHDVRSAANRLVPAGPNA